MGRKSSTNALDVARRRRANSVYREKSVSFVGAGDSKAIEEKLDQMGDLKSQIKGLSADHEEVKLNQEEISTGMAALTHQMSLLADALDRMATSSGSGGGRTDIFRRVSRLSKNSFRHPTDVPIGIKDDCLIFFHFSRIELQC